MNMLGGPAMTTWPATGSEVAEEVGRPTGVLLSCTATERTSCQITAQISMLNKTFWSAGLELRKLPGTPVQLCLVNIDTAWHPRPERSDTGPAAILARCLLKTHPCVTALDITTCSFKGFEALLRDALQDNAHLKILKLYFDNFVLHNTFSSTIPSLANLEELECGSFLKCPSSFCAVIAKVILAPTSLRALRLPKLEVEGRGAEYFLAALTTSSTLEELSLHDSIIAHASPEYHTMFAKYIATSGTLRKLSVGTRSEMCQPALKWILQGLLENRTVTDVILTDYMIDSEEVALVTKLLAGNSVLRRLNIPVRKLDGWPGRQGDAESTVDCSLWLQALAENGTLEAITLQVSICEPMSWKALFNTISEKKSDLEVIIIGKSNEAHRFEKVYEVLAGSGAEEKVFFDTMIHATPADSEMLRCKSFSQFYAGPCIGTWDELAHMFLSLSSLTHLTSAHLLIWIPSADDALVTAISRYVTTTCALSRLELTVLFQNTHEGDTRQRWGAICNALQQNASIKELYVTARRLDEENAELLKNAVKTSRTIRRVFLHCDAPHIIATFVRRLRIGIEENYKVLNLTGYDFGLLAVELTGELFAIRDTARRNADIILWASKFLTDDVYDRLSAATLEQVARHPTLLVELAEQLLVSEAEAAEMVNRKLRCFESMDNFMQLAGVVRERVQCYGVEDGHKQLDSLDEACWRVVKRYLCLDDIKE